MDLCVLGFFWDQGSSCYVGQENLAFWIEDLKSGDPAVGTFKDCALLVSETSIFGFFKGLNSHISAFARCSSNGSQGG